MGDHRRRPRDARPVAGARRGRAPTREPDVIGTAATARRAAADRRGGRGVDGLGRQRPRQPRRRARRARHGRRIPTCTRPGPRRCGSRSARARCGRPTPATTPSPASTRSCPAAAADPDRRRGRRHRRRLRGHLGDQRAGRDGHARRPDRQPRDRRPVRTGNFPAALAVGAGFVWVVNAGDGTVARIDPREDVVIGRRLPVGRDPQDIAVGHGSVWVANRGDGTVTRLSAAEGAARVTRSPSAARPARSRSPAMACSCSTPSRRRVGDRSAHGPRQPRLARRRIPDLARGRRRKRVGRRRAQRHRDAAAQPLIRALALDRGAAAAGPLCRTGLRSAAGRSCRARARRSRVTYTLPRRRVYASSSGRRAAPARC